MDMEKARTMKEAISRFRFPGSRAVSTAMAPPPVRRRLE